jgi:hypothetical protein
VRPALAFAAAEAELSLSTLTMASLTTSLSDGFATEPLGFEDPVTDLEASSAVEVADGDAAHGELSAGLS